MKRKFKEEFEDTNVVIIIKKWKKDKQDNGQRKRGKRTSNDLQNITYKTKDRVAWNPLNSDS